MSSFLGYCAKTAWDVIGEPLLTTAGMYETPDRSYGRLDIPFSPMEKRLFENKEVNVSFGKVLLSNGKDWVWYQIWEDSDPTLLRKGDMIFVHGTGVHSGTLASHSRRYLKAGFRLIVPDLVSHGYSSGLHVYEKSMSKYTAGLHAVLHDMAKKDDEKDRTVRNKWERQPTFMLGLSFGGTVALHYALDYPLSHRQEEGGADEVAIDGIIAVGPILGYSPESIAIPPSAISLLRFINDTLHMDRLEIVVPHKKALDKDPNVYKSLINEDKRSHNGGFRLGHLKLIEDGIVKMHREAPTIKHPVFVQQGGQDRVACHKRTIAWIRRTSSVDKRMAIYPVCQHVIFRKAKTAEEDDAGRIACIEDSVEWMSERASTWTTSHSQSLSNCLSAVSHFYEQESWDAVKINLSDRSSSYASTMSNDTVVSSVFSENESLESSGMSSPEMTEVTPPLCASPSSKDSNAGPLQFQDYDVSQVLTHPLLAKAHKSTLPTLARLAPLRAYRPQWTMSEELRPYDVTVATATAEDLQVVTTGFSMRK